MMSSTIFRQATAIRTIRPAFNDNVGDGSGPIYIDKTDPDFATPVSAITESWAVSGSGGADADHILSGSDMVDGSDAEVSPTFTIVSTELLGSARLVQLVLMEDNFNKHLGNKLKLRRLALGLTQTKVAKAINVTFQQIQKYEKGTYPLSTPRARRA